MNAQSDPGGDDLVGDLIAEVARTHGIAISRDDPVIAVVLLNQLVLRRYLEEAVAPVTATIREATREAVAEIEQLTQAQATWLEQVSLKDRASFLEEQKALHATWKAEMEALIEGQNGALREVLMQTATRLRRHVAAGLAPVASPHPAVSHLSRRGAISGFRSWRWLAISALLGVGTIVTTTLAFWGWTRIAGQ
ncbi:MAG: transcriptional activator TraM [Sphingobacteriia bacterium]|nr:transcriptional activator TraM [Sphingobacteriia bacterium]